MSAITVRLDPTTAGHYLLIRRGIPSCACGVTWPGSRFLGLTEHLVEANAPQIEAQVRAQVAARIDTLRAEHVSSYGAAFDDGFTSACWIAAEIVRATP